MSGGAGSCGVYGRKDRNDDGQRTVSGRGSWCRRGMRLLVGVMTKSVYLYQVVYVLPQSSMGGSPCFWKKFVVYGI